MSLKYLVELFKRFSPATQIALIVWAFAVITLLVVFPAAGTSIITFLVAIKVLFRQ